MQLTDQTDITLNRPKESNIEKSLSICFSDELKIMKDCGHLHLKGLLVVGFFHFFSFESP